MSSQELESRQRKKLCCWVTEIMNTDVFISFQLSLPLVKIAKIKNKTTLKNGIKLKIKQRQPKIYQKAFVLICDHFFLETNWKEKQLFFSVYCRILYQRLCVLIHEILLNLLRLWWHCSIRGVSVKRYPTGPRCCCQCFTSEIQETKPKLQRFGAAVYHHPFTLYNLC